MRFVLRYYKWFVWALVSEPTSGFVPFLGKISKSTLDDRNATGCRRNSAGFRYSPVVGYVSKLMNFRVA
jgi:uncharacterized membrane protein